MLVCHCNGISDRAVRRAVRDGAVSTADVGHACGAGTCCGGCKDAIQKIIHAEASQLEVASSPAPSPLALSA